MLLVAFQLDLAVDVGQDGGVLGDAGLENFFHLRQSAGDVQVLGFHVLPDYVGLTLEVIAVPVGAAEDPVQLEGHPETVFVGAVVLLDPVDRLLQLSGCAGAVQVLQDALDHE